MGVKGFYWGIMIGGKGGGGGRVLEAHDRLWKGLGTGMRLKGRARVR